MPEVVRRPAAKTVLFLVLAILLALVLLEGACSGSLFLFKVMTQTKQPLPERVHTRYDPELGWAALPDVHLPDLYGPGVYFRTNSQGFRSDRDFDVRVPAGRYRIICSGDSMTLGNGVDNENTWCERLSALDPRLETVNMGLGGYGVDQAYLWYLRDGTRIEHHAHLFAVIADDFRRMSLDSFFGYGKPLLALREGRLVTENVPVPRRGFYAPWLTQNLDLLRELRMIQLPLLVLDSVRGESPSAGRARDDVARVALAVFEALRDRHREHGRAFAVVYLPTRRDHGRDPSPGSWRNWLREELPRRGIRLLDLADEFQDLPRPEVETLFIQRGAAYFPGAAGHYTVRGNRYIAARLRASLADMPEVASRLGALDSP